MNFVSRLFFIFLANLAIILFLDYFIEGFNLTFNNYPELVFLTIIFTLLNIFIKPIFKLILSPLIIITLGLAIILVNAAVLYLFDFLSENIEIKDWFSLLLSAIIFTILNFLVNFFLKRLQK